MGSLILKRLFLGIVTLFAVTLVIFLNTEILPGDVASAVLGQGATPETLAVFRAELGLDRPAYVRYLDWLGSALQGDLGNAMTNKRAIAADLGPRLSNTLMLALYAALVAIPLSIALGVIAAINEGRLIDRITNISTLSAISMPEFFLGYLLILFFTAKLGWLPSLATVRPGMAFIDWLVVATLPALTLTLLVASHMLRMTRNSVLAVMSSAYIEMAFLKGVPRSRVIVKHALPNAAAPIITVVALNMAYLVVGVVVVEAVFTYPGLGQYMVDAVGKRDVPVIQACGLVFAAVFVTLNTVADVFVILVNPRLRKKR